MTVEVRHARALRGVAAAVFATFIALTFHLFGGGAFPTMPGLFTTLVFSVLVCVVLTGRRLSLWRLSASMIASQTFFHSLFSIFTQQPAVQYASAANHHAIHHMDHGAVQMASAEPATHAHSSPMMLLSHVAAAAATIAVFYWSEQLLVRLADFGRLLLRVFLPFLLALLSVPGRPASTSQFEPNRPLALGVLRSPVLERGPPVGAL